MTLHDLTEHFGTPTATSTEVMYVCGLCSVETPQVSADSHRCKLNAKQRRRLDEWNKQRAAARAAAVAPRPCDWCQEDVVPGVAHFCAPPVSTTNAQIGRYQADEVVNLLEAAGYTISRSGN
jgi:hypothetical protein